MYNYIYVYNNNSSNNNNNNNNNYYYYYKGLFLKPLLECLNGVNSSEK